MKMRDSNLSYNKNYKDAIDCSTKFGIALSNIIAILGDIFDGTIVTLNWKLAYDLYADSLDFVEIIIQIEDYFDVVITDDTAEKLGINATPLTITKEIIQYIH